MMFNRIAFLALILNLSLVQAQEFKFGKVSKEELEEKVYVKDSSAEAAYIYKSEETYYNYNPNSGITLVTEVHDRIKIYNKDGLDYATKELGLYKSRSSEEEVVGLKGYTYTLEEGKVVKTKLKKDGIFKSEYSKNVNLVKFTLPNVKEGAVIEYKYKIVSPFTQSVDEIYFQYGIPVKKLEVSVKILDWFKFKTKYKGFLPIKPKVSTKTDQRIGETVVTTDYRLTDVPTLKEEKYVSNLDNFRSAVKFEIVSLEIPGRVYEIYSKSWEDVSKSIYKNSRFGGEIAKNSYYADDLKALMQGASSEVQKVAKVISLVRSKVNWNQRRGVYTDLGVKKAYKEGKGNTADINLMLVSMLQYAKLKAYPVLLSTRDHGIPLFPTREGFNYVIAAVNIEGQMVLIDATDPYSLPNVLPTRDLNWFGRIITENGNSRSINLMSNTKSSDITNMMITLTEEGSVEGKCREQHLVQMARMFRHHYNSTNEEDYLTNLEKRRNDIEISNYKIKNNLKIGKPAIESYDFFQEDQVEVIGDKLLFTPLFHFAEDENPFKLENRQYPVDFAFPWEDKYNVIVKIPEGYEVESVPEAMAIGLPDNLGTFRYSAKINGDQVFLSVSTSINSPVIGTTDYVALKEFYNQLVQKQTEKVVLKKI